MSMLITVDFATFQRIVPPGQRVYYTATRGRVERAVITSGAPGTGTLLDAVFEIRSATEAQLNEVYDVVKVTQIRP